MAKPTIQFANIVASPTPASWSQAYNAGKLFAVLSLKRSLEGEEEVPKLASLGKEVISVLEQEYFTLEEKKLETIKQAIRTTLNALPKDVEATFLVASFIQNILYVFIHGHGKILLKRGEHIAPILKETTDETPDGLMAASGFMKDGDTLLLATESFLSHISLDEITNAPVSEIAENLMPRIHELTSGTAAAILARYQEPKEDPQLAFTPEEEPQSQEEAVIQQEENPIPFAIPSRKRTFPMISLPHISLTNVHLSHQRKLYLTIAILLIIVLLASVYFTTAKQQASKTQALFESVYPQAKKKYDNAQALVSLNKNLAREDFQEAKKLLDANKEKFPAGSKEKAQIDELSKQVADALGDAETAQTVSTKTTPLSDSPLLAAVAKHKDGLYKTEDDNNFYIATDTEVIAHEKKTDKETTQLKSAWKTIGGISAFSNNIYVLDKSDDQIYKFVGGTATSKSNYLLTETKLANASDIAIDGSIYTLFSDGSIKKFTRGKEDAFAINGLSSPLSKPTHIFTNADTDHLYILDKGNSRVVVLDKTGNFQNSYKADVIKSATDIAADEKAKSLFVLSGDKLYKIELK